MISREFILAICSVVLLAAGIISIVISSGKRNGGRFIGGICFLITALVIIMLAAVTTETMDVPQYLSATMMGAASIFLSIGLITIASSWCVAGCDEIGKFIGLVLAGASLGGTITCMISHIDKQIKIHEDGEIDKFRHYYAENYDLIKKPHPPMVAQRPYPSPLPKMQQKSDFPPTRKGRIDDDSDDVLTVRSRKSRA